MSLDSIAHILPRYEVVRCLKDGGFNVLNIRRREICHATWTPHLHVAQRWARALNESYSAFIKAGPAVAERIAASCEGNA